MEQSVAEPPSPAASDGSCVAQLGSPRSAPRSPNFADATALRPPRPKANKSCVGFAVGSNSSSASTPGCRRSEQRRPRRPDSEPITERRRTAINDEAARTKQQGRNSSVDGSVRQPLLRASSMPRQRQGQISHSMEHGHEAIPIAPVGRSRVDQMEVGKVPAHVILNQREMIEEQRHSSRPASPLPPLGCRRASEQQIQASLAVLNQPAAGVAGWRGSSRETPRRLGRNGPPRQPSRERRAAAASAERQRQSAIADACDVDLLMNAIAAAEPNKPVRTEVRVLAPPGGMSSLQLG